MQWKEAWENWYEKNMAPMPRPHQVAAVDVLVVMALESTPRNLDIMIKN